MKLNLVSALAIAATCGAAHAAESDDSKRTPVPIVLASTPYEATLECSNETGLVRVVTLARCDTWSACERYAKGYAETEESEADYLCGGHGTASESGWETNAHGPGHGAAAR